LVANSVFRFLPPQTAPAEKKANSGLLGAMLPRPPPRSDSKLPVASASKEQQVWRVGDAGLIPLTITKGLTDGISTEITSGPVDVGTALVTGVVTTE
jgi:hypothetical protein